MLFLIVPMCLALASWGAWEPDLVACIDPVCEPLDDVPESTRDLFRPRGQHAPAGPYGVHNQ